MEITGFEDTAKHPLTTALPENRPQNRNRGFFLKTEPKPTDLNQCETVTTLNCTIRGVMVPERGGTPFRHIFEPERRSG